MIACLRGELIHKSPERLIVDVGGVGYDIFFCRSGAPLLPDTGQEIFLYTFLNVREDALELYGFMAMDEKEMFITLLQVSGIGPKGALNMLSAITPGELAAAIGTENLPRLTKLPGVGKKTAERLCLELKDKVRAMAGSDTAAVPADARPDSVAGDVISALVNLGYQPAKAQAALQAVRRQLPKESPEPPLEELLRLALRSLA